jgi:hypothetical protein
LSHWRWLESEGKASIGNLMRAAVALRCGQEFAGLFPEPAATSMDMLLKQQKATVATAAKRRQRASSRRSITRASSSIDTSSSDRGSSVPTTRTIGCGLLNVIKL